MIRGCASLSGASPVVLAFSGGIAARTSGSSVDLASGVASVVRTHVEVVFLTFSTGRR